MAQNFPHAAPSHTWNIPEFSAEHKTNKYVSPPDLLVCSIWRRLPRTYVPIILRWKHQSEIYIFIFVAEWCLSRTQGNISLLRRRQTVWREETGQYLGKAGTIRRFVVVLSTYGEWKLDRSPINTVISLFLDHLPVSNMALAQANRGHGYQRPLIYETSHIMHVTAHAPPLSLAVLERKTRTTPRSMRYQWSNRK